MNINKVHKTSEREIITYAEHWHSSRIFLKHGKENQVGSYHQFLGSIVFTAFTLEAFLNHVGNAIFESWSDLERLSPKGKINIICEKLEIEPNFGETPWRIAPEIFGIRNKVAHGKNELLRDEKMLSIDNYDERMGEMLRADWQKYATDKNAECARENVEKICQIIWDKTEFNKDELFQSSMQTGSANFVQKEI